jgi:hypothetical protein
VFEKVMSNAVQRLGIVRDQPQDIDELLAKEKDASAKAKEKDKPKDTDEVALAELNPPTVEEMQQAATGGDSEFVVDSNAPKVPNFVGKTMKDVMQEATASGIEVDFFGDGMARAQSPLAGTVLTPGEHIAVRFAR